MLPNSWLLFDAASEYQLLTQPRPDCPEYEVDPITATGLVGLQETLKFCPEFDKYSCLKKWVNELQVTNDIAERVVKNAQEIAEVTRHPNHGDNVIPVRMTIVLVFLL